MRRLSLFAFLSCALIFTACDPIKGKLDVKKGFNILVEQKKNCGPFRPCEPVRKEVRITAGIKKAALSSNSKEAQLSIEDSSGKRTVRLRLPRELPEDRGDFRMSAREIAQPFDIAGRMSKSVNTGGLVHEMESCTYREEYWECYYDRYGRRECYREVRYRPGRQEVEYRVRTTTHSLRATLNSPGNREDELATFTGKRRSSERIYSYVGRCW